MAKTAMDCGQNSHEEACSPQTVSDLQLPKENLKKKETPIPPKNGGSSPLNSGNEELKLIIAFLNDATGKSFLATSKGTQRLIRARLNEGFTVEDFKTVIKVKSEQWKGDIKMDCFLRPQTLFASKFEGYLQEYSRVNTGQAAFGLDDHDTGIRGYGL